MTLLKYNSIQLKWIHLYAKHLHCDDEQAAMLWVKNGLAKHFGEIYAQYLQKTIDK